MLNGINVELPQMLDCREQRAFLQQDLLNKFSGISHETLTLVSFGLNIPGPVKTNPELRKLFDDGLQQIKAALTKMNINILEEHYRHEITGDEYLAAIESKPQEIKNAMLKIEEAHQLGRLFDIDVLNSNGEKLSRHTPRTCFICGRQAQDCARSRRHSVDELTAKIATDLEKYLSITHQ